MPQKSRATVRLSLLMVPPADRERDLMCLAERARLLDAALASARELSLAWPASRAPADKVEDFDAKLVSAVRQVACACTEVMLAGAESKLRREWLETAELTRWVRPPV